MKHKNTFIKCFVSDLRYMIISYIFLISCVSYVGISIISIIDEMKAFPDSSAFYLYTVYNFYPFSLLFLLFAVLPGGGSFCVDWENRYYRYRIIRYGKKKYAVSKALSCSISAAILVFISQLSFIFFLCIGRNVLAKGDEQMMLGRIYYPLMNKYDIWIYFLIRILMVSACAALFSVLALWLSTKIINIFVVLASPIIIYYFFDNLSVALKFPFFLSISKIVRGAIEIQAGPGFTLLYSVCFFLILTGGLIYAFYRGCRKRCENG